MSRFKYSRAPKRSDNAGYASGLERRNVEYLKKLGVNFEYESENCKFIYRKKVRLGRCATCGSSDVHEEHLYTCDLMVLTKSGKRIFIEIKGGGYGWTGATRAKHIALKKQFPDVDFRFVFSNANQKIGKNSKSTNATWCKRYGFKCASELVPKSWLEE